MIIQLDNPTDPFNLLEVIEFHYIAQPGQTSKKTLNIRVKKYRDNADGTFSYSDEPPKVIFVKDVDQHIAEEMAQGILDSYSALSTCMSFVSHIYNSETGILTSII